MYTIFAAKHPEIAAVCKRTTFFALRPWWVSRPHRRTCECTYHNKVSVAEAQRSRPRCALDRA